VRPLIGLARRVQRGLYFVLAMEPGKDLPTQIVQDGAIRLTRNGMV
jgi:hypothetical protein